MVTMDTDYDETMMEESSDDVANNLELSLASTTIDPSVIQSRIRQSASLQKEASAMDEDEQQQPVFPKLSAAQASGNKVEYRRVRCPPHRYTPLRDHWEQILTPLVEFLKLQVRGETKILSGLRIHRSSFVVRILGICTGREAPSSECTLCCSWNYKPSGKPQWY